MGISRAFFVLPIRAGERRLTLALLLQDFFAVGFVTAGRSVRDALFLSSYGSGRLYWMYLASAVSVAGVSLVYAPIAARARRDLTAQVTALLSAIVVGALWGLSHRGAGWPFAALYVAVEVISALLLIQFWTLAGELFHARDARRLFGLIGSGGMVANVVVGLATARLARIAGSRQVLFLSAVLLLGVAASALAAGHWGRARLLVRAVDRRVRGRQEVGARQVLRSGHLRALALLVVLTYFTTTLVDFQFKSVAGRALPVDQLTSLFGYISFWVGAVAVGFQLFGTGRLIQRLGVIGALAVLPFTLALGQLGLALWPTLFAATALRASDSLFRYSLNDATTQILYLPAPSHTRAPAKAFIDGVIKPIAIGLAGAAVGLCGKVLGAGQGGSIRILAWVGLVLCLLWVLHVLSLRSTYLASLRETLRRPDARPALAQLQEPTVRAALEELLTRADAREVLNALELLPRLSAFHLDEQVEALVSHEDPRVRIAALNRLGQREQTHHAAAIGSRFDDPEAEVRASAIAAYCRVGRDKAVRAVAPFLADPDARIRGAAVAGMIRFGGLDGTLSAAESLKALIGHPSAEMRVQAARVLGEIGVRNFYQPVLELMNDPDAKVRSAAIAAAGLLHSPELILPLLYRTPNGREGREAAAALAAFGPAVLPVLERALDNVLEDPAVRRGAAQVLAKLGHLGALELTLKHLAEPDDELRGLLFRGLIRAGRGQRLSPAHQQQLHQALQLEIGRVRDTLALEAALGLAERSPPDPFTLLASALKESQIEGEVRILTLLTVLYPEAEVDLLALSHRGSSDLEAARRRAMAVELLDTLLPRALRKEVLPLLEDGPRQRATTSTLNRTEALRALCVAPSAYLRACALQCMTQVAAPGLDGLLDQASQDPHWLVRETALHVRGRRSPETVQAIAAAHLEDLAEPIRAWARFSLKHGADRGSGL